MKVVNGRELFSVMISRGGEMMYIGALPTEGSGAVKITVTDVPVGETTTWVQDRLIRDRGGELERRRYRPTRDTLARFPQLSGSLLSLAVPEVGTP